MTEKKFLTSVLFFILAANFFAQSIKIDSVFSEYRANNYKKVIELSNKLLKKNKNLNNENLISLYEMTAVSYFALGEKDSSKINFIEILKLNENYAPDPYFISPKIIRFFETIKSDYLQIKDIVKEENNNQQRKRIDSLTAEQKSLAFKTELDEAKSSAANSMFRSAVFPGWGHLYSGYKTKGIILSSVNAALLGSAIYFSVETNKLEKDYLLESNKDLIDAKYDEYNSAYKIRNTLYAAYAAFWLFSQIDLLFFNEEEPVKISVVPILPQNGNNIVLVNFSIKI